MSRSYDDYFMQEALKEALKAKKSGEIPVGAVISIGDKIISRGHNLSINEFDPTLHAEIVAIRGAAKKIKNHRLVEANLYVTLEPCAMCYGAIVHARIKKLFFGAYDKKTGTCGSCLKLSTSNCFNHKPEIMGGIMEKECSETIKNFFKSIRD